MHWQVTTALAALALSTALPLCAEDWLQFRGPTGQGISTETGLPVRWSADSGVEWRTPIPGQGWSSPIVYGERVFVTTATEEGRSFRLLCLERTTGELLWDREIFQQSLESRLQQGNSYATSTPVSDGRYTDVLAFDGSLAAVANDGSIAWTNRDYPLLRPARARGLAPALRRAAVVPFDRSSPGEDKLVGLKKPWGETVIVALEGQRRAALERVPGPLPDRPRHPQPRAPRRPRGPRERRR